MCVLGFRGLGPCQVLLDLLNSISVRQGGGGRGRGCFELRASALVSSTRSTTHSSLSFPSYTRPVLPLPWESSQRVLLVLLAW